MARVSLPPLAYTIPTLPLLDAGDGDLRWVKEQIQAISAASRANALMTPQPAAIAPNPVRDGMIRLARAPWRPIGGSVDQWVYWDAPSASWKAL